MRPFRLLPLVFTCLLPALLPAQVTYTWDPNGIASGTGTGGGTWDTSTLNWLNSEAVVWLNNGTAKAVFPISSTVGTDAYNAGGDYTIDVAANVQARGLGLGSAVWSSNAETTFNGGGSITLTDPLVTVESTTAMFNVPLISSVGLTLDVSFNYRGYLKLNTANPDLLGLTKITEGTLVFNHPGALGPGTSGNGIEIGTNGTLDFNYVSGGDFNYTLADPISITGTSEFYRHFTINFETYATRSATLSGPISLQSDVKFAGGSLDDYGTAMIISTGVISESAPGQNVVVEGEIQLSGTNTFTGIVQVGANDDEDGRLTIPVFNNDGVAGPLGAGSGLRIGYNNGEGGSSGEVRYTGGTATSNRTIQIDGDSALGVTTLGTRLTLTGVISGREDSYGVELEKTGQGTLILAGNNTYAGDTSITNGTLVVGNSAALGTGEEVELGTSQTPAGASVNLFLMDGVTVAQDIDIYNYNPSGYAKLGNYGVNGHATFSGEVYLRRTTYIGANSGSTLTFSNLVSDGSGGGSIIVEGGGTAIFSGGIDLRGGSIDVTQGTVQLSGSVILPSSMYVRSGAKLTGTPTMTFETGSVFVASSGTIQPGLNGTGTFTTENIYLSSGSNLQWQLASLTTSGTPLIALSTSDGNTEIYSDAKLTVDLSLLAVSLHPNYATLDAFWGAHHSWMIVSFASPTSEGNLAPGMLNPMTVMNGSFSKGVFSTYMDGSGNLMLQFTPVPEPATYVLLGLGAVMLLVPRLRRRV